MNTLHFLSADPAHRMLCVLAGRAVDHALRAEAITKVELTIDCISDAEIQVLNRDFRGHDKPTNVLSFPADDPEYLGDIAISLETVRREAKAQGKSFNDHFVHLVVHAVLHLLGHDHEEDEAEAEAMEAQEVRILKRLGVADPYRS